MGGYGLLNWVQGLERNHPDVRAVSFLELTIVVERCCGGKTIEVAGSTEVDDPGD